MRKRNAILFVFILSISMILFSTTACWWNDDTSGNKKDNYIELSLSNYEYYLSIDQVKTDSGSALQGSFRYVSYKVTISGAISGLFQDCKLYYKLGNEEEKEVKLNAAGFATFNYTWSTNSGSFSFTNVEGKIII